MKKLTLILGIFLISFVSALVITSLSNISIVSNDPEIGGETWVATMVGGIGVQEIVGYIDAESIKAPDGRIAEYDLNVREEVSRNRCEYSFSQESGRYIHKISLVPGMSGDLYWWWELDNKQEECRNTPGAYYMAWTDEGLKFKFYCWKQTVDAIKGNLIFDGYRTEVDMRITAKGITKTGTMNNYDTPSMEVGSGDYKAHFRWVGSLVSGERCETPSEQSITGVYKNAVWKTIDENRYDDYRTYHQTGFNSCARRWIDYGTETASSCTTQYNNYASSATSTKTFFSKDGTSAAISGTKAIITLKRAIQFPQLVMRIKTAWLGVKITIAEPLITSLTAEDFTVGEYGTIKVGVKNRDADYQGEFAISINCPSIFQTIGSVPTVRLNPLETKIVNVIVKNIKDIEEKDCERCSVVVYNTEKTTVKDEGSLQVCINPLKICIEDDTRCVDGKFEYCYKGIEWRRDSTRDSECLIEECLKDADCPPAKPFCVNNICAKCRNNRDCPSEFPVCENGACIKRKFKWDNLYLLPILLTLGLAGMFGWNEKQKTGKYHWFSFVIGGALGLGIGFALFWVIRNLLGILFAGFVLGGTALIIILFIGGIPLLLFLINMMTRGRVIRARGEYREFKKKY